MNLTFLPSISLVPFFFFFFKPMDSQFLYGKSLSAVSANGFILELGMGRDAYFESISWYR